jgi:hypothetical protein
MAFDHVVLNGHADAAIASAAADSSTAYLAEQANALLCIASFTSV